MASAALAVTLCSTLGIVAAQAQTAPRSAIAPVAGTASAIRVYQLNPTTGAIVKYLGIQKFATTAARGAHITYRGTSCGGNDFCWEGNPPAANHGYFGTGSSSSSWVGQGGFYTGEYYSEGCWQFACSGELPPFDLATFGGASVTTTGQTIYGT